VVRTGSLLTQSARHRVDHGTICGRNCANSGHYKPLRACVHRIFVNSNSLRRRPEKFWRSCTPLGRLVELAARNIRAWAWACRLLRDCPKVHIAARHNGGHVCNCGRFPSSHMVLLPQPRLTAGLFLLLIVSHSLATMARRLVVPTDTSESPGRRQAGRGFLLPSSSANRRQDFYRRSVNRGAAVQVRHNHIPPPTLVQTAPESSSRLPGAVFRSCAL
jgi:hypothetical protein